MKIHLCNRGLRLCLWGYFEIGRCKICSAQEQFHSYQIYNRKAIFVHILRICSDSRPVYCAVWRLRIQCVDAATPLAGHVAWVTPWNDWCSVICTLVLCSSTSSSIWYCEKNNAIDVFSMSSCIGTSRLVHNGGYNQKLLQLFNSSSGNFVIGRLYLAN